MGLLDWALVCLIVALCIVFGTVFVTDNKIIRVISGVLTTAALVASLTLYWIATK